MNQRGFSAIVILLIALLTIGGIGGYLYYQELNKVNVTPSQPTVSPSTLPTSTTKNPIKLSAAWNLGTKTYSNPKINITFEYPSYFEVKETDIEKENRDWAERYKNNPDVQQPLYPSSSSFQVRFLTPDLDSGNNIDRYTEICDNKMYVSLLEYTNNQNLPLYDFIADLNKTYSGDGLTDTFDTYKKSLAKTSLPKENTYVFTGIKGESPVKEIYFDKNNKVYEFSLIGNCDTGGKYTEDAEKVFNQILGSVKFLES